MVNRSLDSTVRGFLREFSYSTPDQLPDKDDHVSDNLSDLEDILPSLPPSSPDNPYPSLGRSRVYARAAKNARKILNSNLLLFFGVGVGLEVVLWLAARFERHFFRLLLLLLTKGLALTEWILVWTIWTAQYLVLIIILAIVLFSAVIAMAWRFYSSVRAQRLANSISKNPTLHPILFSAAIHSPLLITHQFLPRWLSYTLYLFLISRTFASAIWGWRIVDVVLVPVNIVCALVLVLFVLIQKHTKPTRWWNRAAAGWATTSGGGEAGPEEEEAPSEPQEEEEREEYNEWFREEREEERQEEDGTGEQKETQGRKKRRKKKKKAGNSSTTSQLSLDVGIGRGMD